MIEPGIQFPLSLQPVLRSRQGGDKHAPFVPYHAAIWIVDAAGRSVVDIAPDIDDVLGGRHSGNAHELVARASRMVSWLERVHSRLAALTGPMDSAPDLLVRPLLTVNAQDRTAEVGIQLLSADGEAFDCVSKHVDLFASDGAVDSIMERLGDRVMRRHAAAIATLGAVQDAIEAWRSAEEVTASATDPVMIDDVRLERRETNGGRMSAADHLMHLEEQFWKADAGFYQDHLAPDALMVFADPVGVMAKQAIVDSIRTAPRWRRIEFEESTHVQLKPGVVLLTYRATAARDAGEPYAARASSVYVQGEGGWQLVFHQQTPIPQHERAADLDTA